MKAYDSRPHTGFYEYSVLYKINRPLRIFLNSLRLWKTTLEVNLRQLTHVIIRCSIYYDDALSPLLSCIVLNPFNQIKADTDKG